MSTVIRRIVIHGRVQGVGFRYWAESTARGYGLDGWVRNHRTGVVEAVFSGPPDLVTAMIEACRQGPSSARVTRIDQHNAGADELALRGADRGFTSLPTV
ncbi:MAG: acylphosphatase [Rhizobiales bacterium]|nr:acylphosphatase [Hyphomicrobiales bacterium]